MKKLIFFTLLFFLANQLFAQEANFLWAKQMGGTGIEEGRSTAIDASGNVYTTGIFNGIADFDPGSGIYNLTSFGISDVFISKIDASGNFVWAKQLGGLNNDEVMSITVDVNGNVQTTGFFDGTADFDPGPGVFNMTPIGARGIFISKLTASGNFVWAKQISGATNPNNIGYSITADLNGSVYTTGYFTGTTDFDPGSGTYNMTSAGADLFVLKLDASGNFVWAKQFSGPECIGFSIIVDVNGKIYTTGRFSGTVDFDPGPGIYNMISAGSTDIFVSKLDVSGNLLWAKQFGGISYDIGYSIAIDINGNIYTTGRFDGIADFDPGSGTYNLTPLGPRDIFVSKLDASGNFLWAKQLGGLDVEESSSIAVDISGNVYTTGYFYATADFDPGTGSYILNSSGNGDIFISKLDASGNFVWAKKMGGVSEDRGNSIYINAIGNVYIAGNFNGVADFDPGTGTYNLTSAGGSDVFVVKLVAQALPVLPDPTLLWAKQLGGVPGYINPTINSRNSVTVDANGNVYTIGVFYGTGDFDPGSGIYNLTSTGANDIFISKLDASGNFLWAKQLGGSDNDVGHSISADATGNVYITGKFTGTADFDPGSGTYNMTATGSTDVFVVKLDAAGNFILAKQFGGTGSGGTGLSITFDPSGNIYTLGWFFGTVDFDPGVGTYNLTPAGGAAIFVSKLNASGNFLWAKKLGGTDVTIGYSISLDANGNVYTTGWFTGTADFDPGTGIYNLTSAGYNDIFVSKLDASGNFLWAKKMGGVSNESSLSIAIDNNGNAYATGYFQGTADFDPGTGSYNLAPLGSSDIFVFKLDVSGNFVWAKQMGGVNSYSKGESISIDNNGNVYTAGRFSSIADFDPGAGIYNLTSMGSYDIFVSKLDVSGNFIWAKQMGGVNSSGSNGECITIDNNGKIYITGYYAGTVDFDPGSGTYNLTTTTSSIFVLKFNSFPTPYQLPYSLAQNTINHNANQLIIADPIQLGTGTYSYTHNDIKIPAVNGALNFTRFYNSFNNNLPGPLGYGWSHTYNYYLENKQDTAWDIHYPDGHVSTFIPMNVFGQSFPVYSGTFDSLQKNYNNSYSLFTKDKQQYHFDSTGKLDRIIDLNSNITTLNYTGNSLTSIVAPGGRSLLLTYSGSKISSVKDPLNRICIYSYDGNNNLITVKDPNNGTATFTYDTAHRMLIAKNPMNNTIVDNTYDSSGKVISQKDAYNQVTSIVYNYPNPGDATVTNPDNSHIVAHHDAFIRKTSEKDELNFIKSYTYDANSNENRFTNENNQSERRFFDNRGNLLIDTLPGNKITNIIYNNFNSPVQVTDAKGFIKTFYYNSVNNNLDSIRYPDNSLQVFYYNGLGQVLQSVDGNGNTTTYTYSPAGDQLSIQTSTGIKQFTYDAVGRKISVTDENNHTTTYSYDNNDNLIMTTDALGRTIENTYDANNQLLSVKDRKGYITTYAYDNKGRKISSVNPKGGITTYAYDVRDNLISVTDPAGNIVSYSYDAKGRKISSTNALGITQYQYDGVGNLLKVTDPTNKTTEYSYTPTNKKQSQKDGLSNTTNYAYDLNDNLTSITDPLNRVTGNGYDVMNRLVSVTDAKNKTTFITYDNNGNKKTVVDPNGHTQTYNYDAVNRLINYQDAAGNNYTYGYDNAGNNTTLTKPTGTIGKVFDVANRVTTVNNSTGDNYSYTYDNNDNVVTMSNSVGTTTMTYDSLDQVIQYQDPYSKTVSFTYNAAGNKTSVIYPGNKTVSYTYDNANNLASVTDWLSHTFTYTYDSAGRAKQLLYPNGAKCNYGFDNAGRLISKINKLSTNRIISGSTFTLDAVGNRISEQRLAQAPSALPSLSRAYTYANDDRMLSDSIWTFVHDNSGNRTSETSGTQTASYIFSVDNLLNSRIDTAGANSTYSYDVPGHRIAKVFGTTSNRYVLDISSSLSQILQITDASGVVKSNYVYGLGLLERIDPLDSVLYYHFDAQHNTTLLTGQDSAIKDTYTYDPFGALLNHTGTASQPFTFLGEYGVEQESPELYYIRARYYDAANGRFLSKDAFDYNLNNPQTINRYVYSTNNPASIFDYTGLYGDQDSYSNYAGLYGNKYLTDVSSTYLLWNTANKVFGNKQLSNFFTAIDIIGYSNKFVGFNNGSFKLWSQNFYGNQYVSSSLVSTQKGIFNGLNTAGTIVGAISTGINLGITIDKYKSGQINEQQVFKTLYPDLAEIVGSQLFGPIGGIAAKTTAQASVKVGEVIGEAFIKTSLGDKFTSWLAKTLY